MATRTSVASGNFSSAGTWDTGVPVDGDIFIIASGNTVTVDSGISIPASGYDDSEINGILQHAPSGTSTIRMNGRLNVNTGGTYHMRGDAVLEFTGTNTDGHGLRIANAANSNFIAEGEDGMPSTTLSTGVNEGVTSFSVASSTNFASGEWIAIYDNTTPITSDYDSSTMRDEGFWIHDISGNTIYFRQFVGPESTVVSGENNIIYVENGKIFREGQKVIFGTGANLNIHTITSINYGANELTLSSNIIGVVAGLPIYETGSDKVHTANHKVRKVATVTTVASTDTDTTITVANSNKFTAGDEIWVEQRSGQNGNTDRTYDNYGRDSSILTVSSVFGNIITLTAPIGYNVPAGALVTRLTRRVQVRTTTDSDFAYFYDVYFNTDFTKKSIIKDVYFRRMGMNNSTNAEYRGMRIRGYHSTDNLPVVTTETFPSSTRGPWYESIVMRHSGTSSQDTFDWSTLLLEGCRNGRLRCCFVCNGKDGIGMTNESGIGLYNCISANNDRWNARIENGQNRNEVAYLYFSRGGEALLRIISEYSEGIGYHHVIGDAASNYAISTYNTPGLPLYKFKLTGYRYGPFIQHSKTFFSYSYLQNVEGYRVEALNGTAQRGYDRNQFDVGIVSELRVMNSFEHNFEYDSINQWGYGTERYWDSNENAWRVYNRHDGSDYGVGWGEVVYIPAGVTLRAKCEVKLPAEYSGNYPRFEARDQNSARNPNEIGNSGGSWSTFLSGGSAVQQYNDSARYGYQTRELTISPVNWPRYVTVGVHVDSSNASEGYWMKNVEIYLDKPYIISAFSTLNQGASPRYFSGFGIRNTFNQLITKLGGRLN